MDISVAAALQGKRVLASHHQQATKCLSWLDFLFQKNHKSYSFKFIELRTIKICMTLNLIIGKTFMSRYWCVVILLKSGDRSVSHLLTCLLQFV